MGTRSTMAKMLTLFLAVLLIGPQGVTAQSGDADKLFKQEELEQMLAPIALYPDSLLAQIFMASTYPLEVVQAGRWIKANQNLEGEGLTEALEKENWDPSVKSLVNFPQVLEMMNEKLDWTQKLGDAFLAQQKDVMDTVQQMRAKAQAEGNLKSTEEQKVIVEKETQTIVIEPSNPQVVYVPAYNPTVVYGAWPRRIGRNELSVIQVCLAYVDAQREYALEDQDEDGVLAYAQKFGSTPGKKDGLYWEAREGEKQSPLGPLAAAAQKVGYTGKKPSGEPTAYHGYYYRILNAQGKDAPGGAYEYVVKGKMIGGFALVAYPAQYKSSGIMTFIVNHDDAVYQKDLGKDTEKTAQAMKIFNPDRTWKKVAEASQ